MIEYIIKYYGILFENKSMIHHKKVCQYTFEKKMYYLVHSKSNIRGNVCQTYLMYVSIPMFFPDDSVPGWGLYQPRVALGTPLADAKRYLQIASFDGQ